MNVNGLDKISLSERTKKLQKELRLEPKTSLLTENSHLIHHLTYQRTISSRGGFGFVLDQSRPKFSILQSKMVSSAEPGLTQQINNKHEYMG